MHKWLSVEGNQGTIERDDKKLLKIIHSTKFKLIASFLIVSLLVGGVSLVIGSRLIYRAALNEAITRVRLDLNAAREMYQTRTDFIRTALSVTTLGVGFRSALKASYVEDLVERLGRMAEYAELDFAGIETKEGENLCRLGSHSIAGERSHVANPITEFALQRGSAVAGTFVLSNEFLHVENSDLLDRSQVSVIDEKQAAGAGESVKTPGMSIAAAVPVFEKGELVGILYGGILLNRSTKLVDRVRDTVFQNETYKGVHIGTATIFYNAVRIATNVLTLEGRRAIGTRVSREVGEHVLVRGKKWIDRAFVVNDWYIAAYEPIRDIGGDIVGMLYVGVREAKYADVRRKAISIFVIITLVGMVLATGLGYLLAHRIMSPIGRLIRASRQVSEGSLSPDIGPLSKDELGLLQKTFKEMVAAIGRRRAESQNKLLHSEKQAGIGRLAAGVAHEINNPLTGVLTYSHMLLRRNDIVDEVRSDIEKIVEATERVRKIVKSLLDFSRQTKLDRRPTEVNELVRSTISLVGNQALLKGISLKIRAGNDLPMPALDRGQVEGVLLNIIMNALDATGEGGSITICTERDSSSSDGRPAGVAISVADTGCGIAPEDLGRLFDPFFTTKEVGRGTGLGLSVSLGIIERHGGNIKVQSEVGKGSTFVIWLPSDGKNT